MARRRKKESDLDFFLAAPWQASAVVAVAGFVAFEWIFPAATAGSPILKMLGAAFKPAGYIVGGIFGLIAVVNFFRQRPVRDRARSDPAREYRPVPIAPGRIQKLRLSDDVAQQVAGGMSVVTTPKGGVTAPVLVPETSIQVPFAEDGSFFHPMLRRLRTGKYTVGEKGCELTFDEFDRALLHLKAMPVAKWRRPNDAGNWGIVAAVRWGPLPK